MYTYQLPRINAITRYCKHVLIKTDRRKTKAALYLVQRRRD